MSREIKLVLIVVTGIGIVISFLIVTGIASQIVWLIHSLVFGDARASNERRASDSLKTISMAQAYFRAHYLDESGKNGYWREDVAGLYALTDKNGLTIKLIDLSVASADDHPTTNIPSDSIRSAKAGFWFRALRFSGEKNRSPDRFAICAYPESPWAGRWMFVTNEQGVIYRKVCSDAQPPGLFPKDLEKEGWFKLD